MGLYVGYVLFVAAFIMACYGALIAIWGSQATGYVLITSAAGMLVGGAVLIHVYEPRE